MNVYMCAEHFRCDQFSGDYPFTLHQLVTRKDRTALCVVNHYLVDYSIRYVVNPTFMRDNYTTSDPHNAQDILGQSTLRYVS